jgi:nucleotidyltransferase substrate binding protein (TIGR01987 family)
MSEQKIIIEPLRDAVASLAEALARSQEDDVVRDAVVKRFEYTFELAWKLMRRILETEYDLSESDRLTKKDLFRQAHEVGLITKPEAWFDYLVARNRTSHEYSEDAAEEVCEAAKRFLPDAQTLLVELDKRYD